MTTNTNTYADINFLTKSETAQRFVVVNNRIFEFSQINAFDAKMMPAHLALEYTMRNGTDEIVERTEALAAGRVISLVEHNTETFDFKTLTSNDDFDDEFEGVEMLLANVNEVFEIVANEAREAVLKSVAKLALELSIANEDKHTTEMLQYILSEVMPASLAETAKQLVSEGVSEEEALGLMFGTSADVEDMSEQLISLFAA